MTILSERTTHRSRPAYDAVKPATPARDLLPWADPYIAELCSAERAQETLNSVARRDGGRYRLDRGLRHGRPLTIRNEAPPPLGETPFRYTASTRRDQRQERPIHNPKPTPK